MRANQIMSTPIVFTQGNIKLAQAKDLLRRNKISSAPVLKENGDIEGIISATDLAAIHNENLLVREVMSRRVHVCAMTARIQDVAKIMVNEKIHHIIVMEDGKIHGMISTLDVIEGLLEVQA